MFKEFKEFAMRGNVMDLAIGVVIGGAFGQIVTSFVNDVIMPPIGLLTSGARFKDWVITLKEASGDLAAVTINIGVFINTIVNFLIIAFTIFFVVRALNRMKKKEEEHPSEPPKPSNEEVLLTEIRDLLKNQA